MRLCTAFPSLLLLSPSFAITFDCKNVLKEQVKWNLEKLGGQHQVSWIRHHANIVQNTTYKIDICKALKLTDASEKRDCNLGTRVCSIEHEINAEGTDQYNGAWPVVREYEPDNANVNPKLKRLKKESQEDGVDAREGIEIEMGGGKESGQSQKAIITFLCNKEPAERRRRSSIDSRDDDDGGEGGDDGGHPKKEWEAAKKTQDGTGGTIEFVEYKDNVLELEWTTRYACENAASMPDKEKEPSSGDGESNKGGWGFFSWFFFLIFMLLSGFLIFTAWVNYSRNGARGYDLLPFSDTLRDLPYILGDWWRKIASTLGGSGTRGGYSAV